MRCLSLPRDVLKCSAKKLTRSHTGPLCGPPTTPQKVGKRGTTAEVAAGGRADASNVSIIDSRGNNL